ncbi:winged helix-turn-helix transcriptional regulator [Clostridium sp. D2Q-11]|uniref:Winged helix-turn-helix transcriptional regulator n=1 Tax=Anaeromonas frigoriresistens TaxID=2683708 RepID=A0A942UXT2_9FIRM|nr:metalloregulator ArsR/SmtB family transcription factor [Anaeromonas frigoriresistens]MBS4539560.1 winged helix-turn-helix transcriptional regulator [Anaeromonas frigoriresistens]
MEKILEVLKAISDEKRYRIINLLLQHNFCVKALAKRLNLSQAAISQHLKVLREVGLVKGEKIGYYTHYTVNKEILDEVSKSIKEMSELERTEDKNSHKSIE